MSEAKIYKMNDCDTVVAVNAKQAREYYENEFGITGDEIGPIRQIKALKKHRVWLILKNLPQLEDYVLKFGELKVGMFAGYISVFLTYEQALEVYDGCVPETFSSTEW